MSSIGPRRTSSRISALHASKLHANTWGKGHPHKAGIAISLSQGSIQAAAGVTVDSILVSSIFGPHQPKTVGRMHNVSSLSVDHNLLVDNESRRQIYNRFEAVKGQITFTSTADSYLQSARRLASELHENHSVFQSLGVGGRAALNWLIPAYAMVIQPKIASVRLKTFRPQPDSESLMFGIFTTEKIPAGTYIYELIGLMAQTQYENHSNLSEIYAHPDQNKGQGPRVLFGPIRFLNHECKLSNVEFVAVRDSYAFVIMTKKCVEPGDQLFLNYGKEHFRGEEGGCPCSSCKALGHRLSPSTAPKSSKRNHQPTDEETKMNKKAKKLKNRKNREKGKILGCESHSV